MAGSEELREELAYFEAHRQEWLAELKGKFALVKDSDLIGTFDTEENAYVAGVERFGNTPMLIKQIVEKDLDADLPALTLAPAEEASIVWAHHHAGELMADATEAMTHDVRTLTEEALRYRRGASWLERQLQQRWATAGRDWRRTAITELCAAHTNGYISQLPLGTEVVGRSAPDACRYCKEHVNGKRYTVVSPDAANKDWASDIWVGKTNFGRSFSPRKQVDGVLVDRVAHELGMPTIPLHPFCRCRWIRVLKGLEYGPRGEVVILDATREAADRVREMFGIAKRR